MIHFKIGITFSGKYRKRYIEPICNELLKLGYSRDDIFYDEWHEVLINGVNGDEQLCRIYNDCCDSIVVLLSPDYKEKHWTGNVEWRSVKELINTGKDGKICLLAIDSVNVDDIDGLYRNQTIAKYIDGLPIREIAEFIDQKYKLITGGLDTYTGSAKKTISQYKKPGLIQQNFLGVDIRPEWVNYLKELTDKLSKYLQYYGHMQPHYKDGYEWNVTRCSKNGILIMLREDIESEKSHARSQLCVYDDYNAAFPDECNLVFSLVVHKNTIKLEYYVPGDWDEKIFSWP